MDRGFDLPATPEKVWPWFNQLGKTRSGWYAPGWIDVLIPRKRRALRHIDADLQGLQVGDVIDDWGGRNATFTIDQHDPPHALVHRSTRGNIAISWAILLRPTDTGTRVHLRLRIAGTKRRRLVEIMGGAFDLLTISALAAGLRERLTGKP